MNRIQRLVGRQDRRYVTVMPVATAAVLTLSVVTALAALQLGSGARVADSVVVPLSRPAEKVGLLAHARQVPVVGAQKAGQAILPDKVLFDRAISNIEQGNYLAARLTLNSLINSYPNSSFQMRAKLAIADSWFREGNLGQAKAEYRDFIKFYPGTEESREARLKLMSIDPYEKWVLEDVVYIITEAERKAFNQLTTDEEREMFVEQFWARRDPTPGTPENEFKAEHYRRIAYANAHWGVPGLAGWRTDRGRIYIQYGPPDEIEAHSVGGSYERPQSQGGGVTETFPFEQWRYRYIEGVGQNVVLEFVDKMMNGEFRLTMDPNEKDALRPQPGTPPR